MKNISLSPRYKRAKTDLIVSAGQKCVQLEKDYLHSYWISDAKIWMTGGQRGNLSSRKRTYYLLFIYWPGYKLFKNGQIIVLLLLVIRKIEKSMKNWKE